MKHYGDITKISGAEVPVVDIITGGSPCQDLSVAGKRAGLAGKRSGLFMEQMRIVKEMRERDVRDNGRTGFAVRPRYMVWENVPGAFSSGNPKGADFAAVIEEIIKVAEPDASVSVCVPNGGWTKSGCYYAEDGSWSIAWRVHDAQFWGVPQRRKRIALVADFGGLSAPEILFEREGLSGDFEPCGEAGQETAGAAGESSYPSVARSLTRRYDGSPCIDRGPDVVVQEVINPLDSWQSVGCDVYNQEVTGDVAASLTAASGGTNTSGPKVLAAGFSFGQSAQITSPQNGCNPHYGDPCHPLAAGAHPPAVAIGNGQLNQMSMAEQANTLDTMHDQQAVMCFQNTGQGWRNESDVGATIRTPCGGDSVKANLVAAVDCRNATENADVNGTLQAKEQGQNLNSNNVLRCGSVVRRLTPLECERLQGYPDGWTDIGEWTDTKGKKHKPADSPRYKALGNSIALPFWAWLARRICAQYERPATMASLFDGIGGFPLVFQRSGAVPVWASEIEEFPIAVTKKHFPEE